MNPTGQQPIGGTVPARQAEMQPLIAANASGNDGPIDFSKRVSQYDDKYLGQKMPSRLANGPVRNRVLTDKFCCIVFAIFFIGWIVVGSIYASKSASLSSLDDVMDSEGNICGQDPNVKDYPYLFMVKFTANYRSVCVKSCPKFDYNQIKYNSTGTNTTYIQPVFDHWG